MSVLKIVPTYMWKNKFSSRRESSTYLRKSFETLGPTYIKIGQLIASRGDIFDDVLVNEMKTLQDRCKPFDSLQVIERNVDFSKFIYVDPEPLASASLSSVHKAKLVGGGDVVIKVLRPNLRETIESDLNDIQKILMLGALINPSMDEVKSLVDEWRPFILEELDLNHEIENIRRFARMGESLEWLRVPGVYADLCSPELIVMDFIEGARIDQVPPTMDPDLVARTLLTFTFDQVLEYQMLHGDPHAGNVLITPEGKISYIDYGLCVTFDSSTRQKLTMLLRATVERDIDTFYDLLVELDIIITYGSSTDIKRFLRVFFLYLDRPLDTVDITVMRDLENGRKFRFSIKWIIFFKSVVCIDGINKTFSQVELRDVLVNYSNQKFGDSFDPRGFLTLLTAMPASVRTINTGISLLESTILAENRKISGDIARLRWFLILVLAAEILQHG